MLNNNNNNKYLTILKAHLSAPESINHSTTLPHKKILRCLNFFLNLPSITSKHENFEQRISKLNFPLTIILASAF